MYTIYIMLRLFNFFSVRVKFMLDTLLAIKNNNMTKIPQYDPTRIERLKKLIRSMIRTGQHLTELKITVDDILNGTFVFIVIFKLNY